MWPSYHYLHRRRRFSGQHYFIINLGRLSGCGGLSQAAIHEYLVPTKPRGTHGLRRSSPSCFQRYRKADKRRRLSNTLEFLDEDNELDPCRSLEVTAHDIPRRNIKVTLFDR